MYTCGCVLNIHSSIWKLHTANTFSEDTICRRTHFQWRHIEDRLRTRFVEGHIEDTSVARTDCAAAAAARPEAESGGGGHVTCAQFVHICAAHHTFAQESVEMWFVHCAHFARPRGFVRTLHVSFQPRARPFSLSRAHVRGPYTHSARQSLCAFCAHS